MSAHPLGDHPDYEPIAACPIPSVDPDKYAERDAYLKIVEGMAELKALGRSAASVEKSMDAALEDAGYEYAFDHWPDT